MSRGSSREEQRQLPHAEGEESKSLRLRFPRGVETPSDRTHTGNSLTHRAATGPPGHEPSEPVTPLRPIIEMRNLQKTYLLGSDGIPAVRGVSLTICEGEMVAVYGASGSGKSTLLSTIGTIDRHSKGDLHLFGKLVTERHASDAELADIRMHHIGFVFQSFNLLPTLTAIENVELPMILAGKLPLADRRRRAHYLLDKMGMGHREKSLPAQMSGGEQQRVTIARALANQPSVLLLDEPTGDLDTRNTDVIMNYLLELHEETAMTLVMVTHDVGLRHYADRVIQMSDGKVTEDVEVARETKLRARSNLRRVVSQPAGPTVEQGAINQSEFIVVREPSNYRAVISGATGGAPEL